MNSGENTDSIPIDLILDILSRLPSKSIARFRCVSKLWGSMLRQPYFTKLFLTRSSARPHLLIAVEQEGEWSFFSLTQPQNYHGKSSLVVAADFHMNFFEDTRPCRCSYASGLIYFPNMLIPKKGGDEVRVICNPSTGQYAYVILPPELRLKSRTSDQFLGFDPIDKQFKILLTLFNFLNKETDHHILTLGAETVGWRKIQCPLSYILHSEKTICINGVLYYLATPINGERYDVLVCFDVRSEKFMFIRLKFMFPRSSTKLINYKGKLGVINLGYAYDGGFPLELSMWVLEDFGKEEWSKYFYTLRADNKVVKVEYDLSVVGVTALGEIVLVKTRATNPFYVFYFNPERNTLLSVKIKGFKVEQGWYVYQRIYAFVDHVEDLEFNIMKTTYAAKSTLRKGNQVGTVFNYPQPDLCTLESANKFNALCLLDDDDDDDT
ncbi:F-box-like domain superfamily [Arabidopsis suecica]|uniref:F-box-like domain superfamily n=1 Tax=Arabidopsis suecica TaxID=45249 RepID=A0A8T2CKP0_ARASU|nr:F-box-like domain superfamily [Arabidopsis suecica]